MLFRDLQSSGAVGASTILDVQMLVATTKCPQNCYASIGRIHLTYASIGRTLLCRHDIVDKYRPRVTYDFRVANGSDDRLVSLSRSGDLPLPFIWHAAVHERTSYQSATVGNISAFPYRSRDFGASKQQRGIWRADRCHAWRHVLLRRTYYF